jgi:predicted GNAT family N-acyltransferase
MSIIIKEIAAKDTWDLRHRAMWPNKNIAYVKLPEDDKGIHYGLLKDTELISVISVFFHNDEAQFRKFATEKTEQGYGYGSALLSFLMVEIYQKEASKIWCNARTEKASFYKKFGMEVKGEKFYKGNIEYVKMEKVFSH